MAKQKGEKKPASLRIPLILVALYWIGFLVNATMEMDMGPRFGIALGTVAMLVVGLGVWWFRSGEPVSSLRWVGLGTLAAGGLIAYLLRGHEMMMPLFFYGLPFVLSLATVALAVVWNAGEGVRRYATIAALLAGCAFTLLFRLDGIGSDGVFEVAWRWAETNENDFLANISSGISDAVVDTVKISPGDWPGFRGPERNSLVRYAAIPTDWQAFPPREVWRRKVGPGWSSMSVAGGLLFTQEQRGDSEAVVAYDTKSGEEIWAHLTSGRFEETVSGAGPRATPTFVNSAVYALTAGGKLNKLDAGSGQLLWQADIVKDGDSKTPEWGYAGSPLVVGNMVSVFSWGKNDKSLLAYDINSGRLRWSASVGTDGYSSPQLFEVNGEAQIVCIGEASISGVSASNGKVLWTFPWKTSYGRMLQPALLEDGKFIAAAGNDASLKMLQITGSGDNWQVEEIWKASPIKVEFWDFVTHKGYGYGYSRKFMTCFDLSNGKRIWKGQRRGPGQVLLLKDLEKMISLTEKGEVILSSVSPDGYEELGSVQALSGKTWNHPVFANGNLFVRNGAEMVCYELGGDKKDVAAVQD